jgi:hypothetical protein
LLAPYVVKITKMWRKFGCWLWIATRDLEDFPAASKRMLNMMEWWLAHALVPIEGGRSDRRFKELSAEQRATAGRPQGAGKYTEGWC